MVVFGMTMMVGPRRWADLARAVEEAGFESVWVPEHLIMPVTMTGRRPTPRTKGSCPSRRRPRRTIRGSRSPPWRRRPRLCGSDQRLQRRSPAPVQHGSLADHPRCRIGRTYRVRYRSQLAIPGMAGHAIAIRDTAGESTKRSGLSSSYFTDEVVEHEGEFFRFQPVGFLPKAVQTPWPPMHIGGDSPAAMRRAAELGDGWIPMQQSLETLPRNLELIQARRAEAGRTGPFQVTLSARVTSIDDVRRHEDAGATRLLVSPS